MNALAGDVRLTIQGRHAPRPLRPWLCVGSVRAVHRRRSDRAMNLVSEHGTPARERTDPPDRTTPRAGTSVSRTRGRKQSCERRRMVGHPALPHRRFNGPRSVHGPRSVCARMSVSTPLARRAPPARFAPERPQRPPCRHHATRRATSDEEAQIGDRRGGPHRLDIRRPPDVLRATLRRWGAGSQRVPARPRPCLGAETYSVQHACSPDANTAAHACKPLRRRLVW